jgi:hypothetical protein|tara:strand:+ start:72 stop:1616 length:1545 start_codon:yes stop_codon:yes gene_type:complete
MKVRVKKKIQARNSEHTLSRFKKFISRIYSDELLLQRLLDMWNVDTGTSHMIAFLEGHSNIYSLVLIDVRKVLADAELKLRDFVKADEAYKNIEVTIKYLQNILDEGYEYLCVDGQHRIDCYRRYLEGKFALNKSFIVEYEIEKGRYAPYDLKGQYFHELPECIQKHIEEQYKVLITMIEKGSMEDLVNVTIYTNLGEPWNRHEMRVILPSAFNIWLQKLQNKNALLMKVFKQHISDMSGKDYKLSKKGDSLMISEWVGYIHNARKGKIYAWPKSDMLDTMASIEGLKTMSKKILKDSESIISKMAELVHSTGVIPKKGVIKRSTIDNLIILLTAFSDSKHSVNTFKKVIKINDARRFYDWFLKTDLKLRNKDAYVIDPTTNKIMINPTTNTKLKNSESYNSKCGAKKVDDITLRLTMLFKEFVNDYNKLSVGVITAVDDTPVTSKDREAAAISSDFMTIDGDELEYMDIFGEGNDIDVEHTTARRRGGATDEDNLVLRTASKNRSKGSKVETF